MPESVLITGGAGFIGSHIADALLERGHRVRVFDNLTPQVHGPSGEIPSYLNPEVEFIRGDVRDVVSLRRALEGIDVVYHKAAAVGVGQSMYQIREYTEVNTLGAANLLHLIANEKTNVRKIIVASSMSAYGEGAYADAEDKLIPVRLRPSEQLSTKNWEMLHPETKEPLRAVPTPEEKPLEPNSIYAINKRDHEEMFLCIGAAYGIPAVALRYFNVYGPRQALSNPYTGVMAIFSSRLMNGRAPVIFEDGLQTRDFVHVTDIAQANVLAMESDTGPAQVFNVGTGRFTTILSVCERLSELLGAGISPSLPGEFRVGDIRSCVADISRAQRVLGYQPRVSLEEGLPELIEWVRTQTPEDHIDKAVEELRRRGLAS